MWRSVLDLCIPLRNGKTEHLFENNPDFINSRRPGLYQGRAVLSGLVISETDTNPLVHQAATSAGYQKRRVLVVMAGGRWGDRPSSFHQLPKPSPDTTKQIRFLYPKSLQEVVDHLVDLEFEDVPDTILIQHLDIILNKEDLVYGEAGMLLKFASFITEYYQAPFPSLSSQELPSYPEVLCFGRFPHLDVDKLLPWWKEVWFHRAGEQQQFRLSLLSNKPRLDVTYALDPEKKEYFLLEITVQKAS